MRRPTMTTFLVTGVLLGSVAGCGGDGGTGPGEIPDAGNVMAISAGGAHTCALRTDGAAFCWGQNTSGELGDGTLERRLSPVPVMGGHTFRAISAGDTHTCAITTLDRVYCWGDNRWGQLGTGTTEGPEWCAYPSRTAVPLILTISMPFSLPSTS